ncbi:MAG: DUF1330 domain-containing protein [Lachnospiraceae bacterium]
MAYYFMIDTYIDEQRSRAEYDAYIKEVKPIVEKYHGTYLARTEEVQCLSEKRTPQRVILIKFPTKEELDACFSSEEYKHIMAKRVNSVDARAIIVPGEDVE